MNKTWKFLIPYFVIVFFVITLYFPITKTFYQQDEWLGYGLYLAKGSGLILQGTNSIISLILGQGRVLTNLLYFFFYKYFPLNVFPISVFAIVFHSLNCAIIFYLAKKLFNNTISALLGSLFFAINSVSVSAIIWPAASINTLPSTTLILIALIFYFKFIEKFEQKWLLFTFLTIYLSLFFKETGIFLFLLLPLATLIFKKTSFVKIVISSWYYFLFTTLIVGYRLFGFASIPGREALFLTGSSKYFLDSIVMRAILYPLTSFSLSIVPPASFLDLARYLTNVYYPFFTTGQFDLIVQTVSLDLVAIISSISVGLVIFLLLMKSKENVRKIILFWITFLLASFLPYVIISKSYAYLDSRYYYLGTAAWAVIFSWVLSLSFEKVGNKFARLLIFISFMSLLIFHIDATTRAVNQLVKDSQIRIKILSQIRTLKPSLDKNVNVFYVTGNTDFYLIGNKIPFQEGFGYTLMTLYYNNGKIPSQFLNDQLLFEIGSQDYKESDGKGFGYFGDRMSLDDNIRKGLFRREDVVGLYFDSASNKVTEIKSLYLQ